MDTVSTTIACRNQIGANVGVARAVVLAGLVVFCGAQGGFELGSSDYESDVLPLCY